MSEGVKDLATVLADECEKATILRSVGELAKAQLIEDVCARVTAAAEDYLRWLGESDASIMSGRSVKWLRSQFPEWESQGHARKGEAGRREYRMIVLPRRPNLSAAREEGRRAARDQAA